MGVEGRPRRSGRKQSGPRASLSCPRRRARSKIRIWLDEIPDGELWLPPGLGGDRPHRIHDGLTLRDQLLVGGEDLGAQMGCRRLS